MVSWYEWTGERADPKSKGSVRLNTFYETRKKPLWLLSLKLLGMLAIIGVGFALLVPLIPLPPLQSIAIAGGCILIYVGIAFFVRPEPDGDNMGFLGGMVNDPMHYSDNINRALWNAHCFLGPGRYLAETILDITTQLGLTADITTEQAHQEQEEQRQAAIQRDVVRWREEAKQKVDERRRDLPDGQVELSTASYLDPDRFEA